MPIPSNDCEALTRFFSEHGGTDVAYLRHHWPRFTATQREVLATRALDPGARVLDIGAHWLHQAATYAVDGHHVHAMDLALTMKLPQVESAARELGITLLVEDDLAQATALQSIPDDYFDLVLFTEIIEHITFNPVAMWKAVYRVLKPQGRIVVTTPNYYGARSRLWDARRLFAHLGGGLDVAEILSLHTHAHHWKEFSLREVIKYFCVLSPDFDCVKAKTLDEYHPGYLGRPATRIERRLERHFPLFRPGLHVEVQIRSKHHGIVVTPHW